VRIPCLLPLGAWLGATAAAAEETGPAPLPQVIITARGYAEAANTVPLSMTSVDTNDLDRLEIRDLDALAAAAPGLAYTYTRGTGGVPVVRGMSQTDTSIAELENNVAMVFDGVYVANAFAVDPTMADLERVDVLRGPQNATLGRNAFAGAVMYSPQRPTGTWQGEARVGAGSNQFREGMAALGGPLSPSLGLRLAVRAESFDGTITNQAEPPQLLGGWSKLAASGMLVWKGAENSATAELAAHYFKDIRDATARYGIGGTGYTETPFNCGGADPVTNVNYCGVLPGRSSLDISPEARGLTTDTFIGKLQLEIPLAHLQLTSVTAYVTTYSDTPADDWDATSTGPLLPVVSTSPPYPYIRSQRANEYFSGFPTNDREWSQELRLASREGRVRWMLGAAYSANSSFYHSGSSTDSSGLAADEMFSDAFVNDQTRTPLNLIRAFEGRGTDRISAAFGSLGTSFGHFELQGELRYSRDRWHGETLYAYGPVNEPPQHGQWEFWTPRLTFEYHKSADELLYVSAAKGARSGGFNDPSPPVPSEAQFQPEENWTYEAGMKSRLAAGRVQLSAAAYYTDWSNMQMQGLSSDPYFPSPVIRNLVGSIVSGVEVTLEAHPSAWLDFGLAYAYADARFRGGVIDLGVLGNCSPTICNMVPGTASNPLVPDVGGNDLPSAPRNALALRATLHGRWAGDRQWYAGAGFDATDRQFITSDNVNWLGARHLLSAGAGITARGFELSLWGRNLLDQRYATNAGFGPTGFGDLFLVVDSANGRRLGASITYHFASGDR